MSEHPLGIDRREFLCASTKGAAVLALLPDLFKAAVSFHSGSKASSEAKQAEKRFHASDGELNPRWTFESFVIGVTNQCAHAACIAVSGEPPMYNPLFIHGAAGLGKTHLLHAIGHRISARKSGERVVYTTGTRFCDEFKDAIEFTSQRNFYRRYRRADVLLIDDIQCLAGNASAQKEFLDTFNAIFASYGQIVISSDRPPDMTKVEPELIQRFQWGLEVELLPLDGETPASCTFCSFDSFDPSWERGMFAEE